MQNVRGSRLPASGCHPLPSAQTVCGALSEFLTTHFSLLPSETSYRYEWSLTSHPVDYRDEIKERHSQTLNLSHVSNWRIPPALGLFLHLIEIRRR